MQSVQPHKHKNNACYMYSMYMYMLKEGPRTTVQWYIIIMHVYMYVVKVTFYLCFLSSSNEAFRGETLEGIIVGGALISPLKLVSITGRVHYVKFPINTHRVQTLNFFKPKSHITIFFELQHGYRRIPPHSSQCPPPPQLSTIINSIPDILESNSTSAKLDDSGAS